MRTDDGMRIARSIGAFGILRSVILPIMPIICLPLQGCFHYVTTTVPDPIPCARGIPPLQLVDTGLATQAFRNQVFKESGGRISGDNDAQLRLAIHGITVSRLPFDSTFGLFLLNMVFPPLVVVPTRMHVNYSLNYDVSDPQGQAVFARRLSGTISGNVHGWNGFGAAGCDEFSRASPKYVKELTPRLVLRDLHKRADALWAIAENRRAGNAP